MQKIIRQFKLIFSNADLRRRFLILFLVIFFYSVLNIIPIPVVNKESFQNILLGRINSSGLLGFANLFSGGALGNFSILMLGLGPYINASIVIQLLTGMIPALDNLSKEGESGRAKINQLTRVLTLPLAILQSFAMILFVRNLTKDASGSDILTNASPLVWVAIIASLIAGSMILMWLGEIITEYAIGNGISILILAGIASRLPSMLGSGYSLSNETGGTFQVLILLILSLAIVSFVIVISEAVRKIQINYTKKTAINSANQNYIPLKLITVGVIPIIFALAFLSLPTFLGQVLATSSNVNLVEVSNFLNRYFVSTSFVYSATYFVLVILFSFFYTSVVFKPQDIADNLQKSGGFILGIRPGEPTVIYLKKLIYRLTGLGSLALGFVAVMPYILERFFSVSSNIGIGGTSLLIVVGVILETVKQVQAKLVNLDYERFV